MSKLVGPEMIWDVIDRVIQVLGPVAASRQMQIERLLRQVRVYKIFAGSDEMQKRGIAKALIDDPSLAYGPLRT